MTVIYAIVIFLLLIFIHEFGGEGIADAIFDKLKDRYNIKLREEN